MTSLYSIWQHCAVVIQSDTVLWTAEASLNDTTWLLLFRSTFRGREIWWPFRRREDFFIHWASSSRSCRKWNTNLPRIKHILIQVTDLFLLSWDSVRMVKHRSYARACCKKCVSISYKIKHNNKQMRNSSQQCLPRNDTLRIARWGWRLPWRCSERTKWRCLTKLSLTPTSLLCAKPITWLMQGSEQPEHEDDHLPLSNQCKG
jgi:hypothetical protein